MAAPDPPSPPEVYLTFCSGIDQASVGRLMLAFNIATQRGAECIHMLFQSTGGTVGDGVCLYNFFRTFPIKLTLYNVGSVQSIAAVAYLGAKERVTSANAIFAFHRTSISPQYAMAFALKNYAETVGIDDRRTEEILRFHVKWGDEKWAHLDRADLWVSAQEAVDFRIADKIGDFSPPPGTVIYNV
jgi:ATP-dependent Clp protease, protease subunit